MINIFHPKTTSWTISLFQTKTKPETVLKALTSDLLIAVDECQMPLLILCYISSLAFSKRTPTDFSA